VNADAPIVGPLPALLRRTLRRLGVRATRHVLVVRVPLQSVWVYERRRAAAGGGYALIQRLRASTSRMGTGQVVNSLRTPLGLHCVAAKVGAGWPVGTVFENRLPVGAIGQGRPHAAIAHRILRLAGLEPGFNQGGDLDTFRRCIYLHGLADEPTLGRPASRGCIHLAAADLLPLFDRVGPGTLVWITGVLG